MDSLSKFIENHRRWVYDRRFLDSFQEDLERFVEKPGLFDDDIDKLLYDIHSFRFTETGVEVEHIAKCDFTYTRTGRVVNKGEILGALFSYRGDRDLEEFKGDSKIAMCALGVIYVD